MSADTLWLGAFLAMIASKLDSLRGESGLLWHLTSVGLFISAIVAVWA